MRKSQETTFSGVSRSQACRPSCGISCSPKFLRANSVSGKSSSAHSSPVRGASPTNSARPDSSTPRNSSYSSPVSTTIATRGSRRRSVQRRLRTTEYSHIDEPSQTNQSVLTCGAPPAETVATRQVRWVVRNASSSPGVIMIRRPRRCVTVIRPAGSSPR